MGQMWEWWGWGESKESSKGEDGNHKNLFQSGRKMEDNGTKYPFFTVPFSPIFPEVEDFPTLPFIEIKSLHSRIAECENFLREREPEMGWFNTSIILLLLFVLFSMSLPPSLPSVLHVAALWSVHEYSARPCNAS